MEFAGIRNMGPQIARSLQELTMSQCIQWSCRHPGSAITFRSESGTKTETPDELRVGPQLYRSGDGLPLRDLRKPYRWTRDGRQGARWPQGRPLSHP